MPSPNYGNYRQEIAETVYGRIYGPRTGMSEN